MFSDFFTSFFGPRPAWRGLVLLLFLLPRPGAAQYFFGVKYAASEAAPLREAMADFKTYSFENQYHTLTFSAADSASWAKIGTELLRHLHSQSYLVASLDSLRQAGAMRSADLYLGPALRWVQLRPSAQITRGWLAAAGFREKHFGEKPLRHELILNVQTRLLATAENNGYPFAQVWLDSLDLAADGGVSAVLRMELGRYFTFKNTKIVGDLRLPRAFLSQFLGLRPGAAYDRSRVLALRNELRALPFLEATANPTVTFAGNEAIVNLYLQKKRAGRFDFLVGLLPRPNAAEGGLLVTGSLSAAFQNALNQGERIAVEFERLRPETQKLDAQAALPYLFGTPFGAEGHLLIFRRDSTWVDAQADLGVQYLLPKADFVRFFWENRSSSLQKVDTASILLRRQLPPNLDYRQQGFGLEAALTRLNYRFNPRQGWLLQLKGVAGLHRVLRNSQIEGLSDPDAPDFRFTSLYDSVANGANARFRLESRVEYFIPFFQRSTLRLALRGAGIFSKKAVFTNEQYRLGGNKLLRGFDEESLFATRYVVSTAEWRLLIGPNSFLSAFVDGAYLENITERTRVFLRPLGFGVGLNFETKAGIFGITMAVGRQDAGQSVDLRAAKFHLGYVSLF